MHHAIGLEAEDRQASRRPARGVPTRRIAHNDGATETKQGSGTLGDGGWRPESSGDDEVIPSAVARIPADNLGAGLDHVHPGVEAERHYGFAKKDTSASPGINQGPQTFRPGQGEDETWHPGTRAEVDSPARCVGRSRKPQGVIEGVFYGAGSE